MEGHLVFHFPWQGELQTLRNQWSLVPFRCPSQGRSMSSSTACTWAGRCEHTGPLVMQVSRWVPTGGLKTEDWRQWMKSWGPVDGPAPSLHLQRHGLDSHQSSHIGATATISHWVDQLAVSSFSKKLLIYLEPAWSLRSTDLKSSMMAIVSQRAFKLISLASSLLQFILSLHGSVSFVLYTILSIYTVNPCIWCRRCIFFHKNFFKKIISYGVRTSQFN